MGSRASHRSRLPGEPAWHPRPRPESQTSSYFCGVTARYLFCFLLLSLSGLHAQGVLVTELMVDPTPVVGLPNAEYVEIFNASGRDIPLTSISIASGGRAVRLDTASGVLAPGAYGVLTKPAAAGAFTDAGIAVLTTALPGLTNTADQVTLYLDDELVAQIDYSLDWYNDPDRDGGGYALEYTGSGDINCAGNWRASLGATGGTPGRVNSVAGTRVDSQPPRPAVAEVTDSGAVIRFDEDVVVLQADLFLLDGAPVTLERLDARTFLLGRSLTPGLAYRLAVLPDYGDCAGNFPSEEMILTLFRPGRVAAGDLLINEVLFDPVPEGEDFVELYNASDQLIELRGWQIANVQSTSRPRTIDANYLLPPGAYVVVTPDTADLRRRFPGVDPGKLLEASLPTLPNTAGNVTLLTEDGLRVDAFSYTEAMHSPLLSDVEGVSLERVRLDRPTDEVSNWASAASTVGYATPTRENSQSRTETAERTEFYLVDTAFSPDGDGNQDRLELAYRTPTPGWLARVRIFDARGRPVGELPRTSLLGAAGVLHWDGTGDGGQAMPTGAYVLLVEAFAPDGRTETYKLLAVLAG